MLLNDVECCPSHMNCCQWPHCCAAAPSSASSSEASEELGVSKT